MVSCSHLIIVNNQRSNELICDTIICQQNLVDESIGSFNFIINEVSQSFML